MCTKRAAALARLVTTIDPVKTDWASHLDAMKTKHEANPDHYWSTWYTLVRHAPERLKAYTNSVTSLNSAPSCPGI